MEELIIVKQLPVIFEQLESIKPQIQEKVSTALALDVSEDTVKEIKNVRTELNKLNSKLEDERKKIKKEILAPYEQFDKVFKNCVTDILNPADAKLKAKIDAVENGLCEQKKTEIVSYYKEYALSKNIDFISFDRLNLNITSTATPKSLKESVKAFLDKVSDELSLIDTQENKAEILVEYKSSLNVAQAITAVTNRHKAIEEERQRIEREKAYIEAQKAAEQKADEVIKECSAPVAVPVEELEQPITAPVQDPVKTYEVTFTVRGTLEQIKALKKFLTEGEFDYE